MSQRAKFKNINEIYFYISVKGIILQYFSKTCTEDKWFWYNIFEINQFNHNFNKTPTLSLVNILFVILMGRHCIGFFSNKKFSKYLHSETSHLSYLYIKIHTKPFTSVSDQTITYIRIHFVVRKNSDKIFAQIFP